MVELQTRQPFRPDALSYPAALAAWRGVVMPSAVAFVLMAAAEAVAVVRGPRTPAGFAAATAFAFLVFFSLSKQAFANYYFFVIGATVCAVAASACAASAGDASPANAAADPTRAAGGSPRKRVKR